MRVVITGATGNAGTSLIQALANEDSVDSILGIARRLASIQLPKTSWVSADVSRDDLTQLFHKADVVVHLAWLIQPSRRMDVLRATNVDGSKRVFEAAAACGVKSIVYASSVAAYSPGPKDDPVDESWSTGGIPTSFYSRHKAEVEAMLDDFEREHPATRVVRLRPALIFKRESAEGQRRLFAGPLLPSPWLRPGLIPLVPDIDRLRIQAIHSYDVAEAYRLAIVSDVRGPFNVAADPAIGVEELAELFDARRVKVPPRLVRGLTAVSWRMHLQPSPEGWLDMAMWAPLLDATRARVELGWKPERTGIDALRDVIEGMRDGAGFPTPPLDPEAGGPWRLGEFASGIGWRG